MRILAMTAVFGKLDGQTLALHEGLNVLTAPNEWGKSTWCAFLCAMLYGLEPSGDPTHYHPWSGRPMEGTLRILHQDRDITIQRRTRGTVPLGEFLAWETQTGRALRELTAENCGQVLLGVDRALFLQTGFVPSAELPESRRQPLRPEDLPLPGSGGSQARKLAGQLRTLQERCAGSDGRIAECQSRLRALQETHWSLQHLQNQHDALCGRSLELEQELEQLENHRTALAWAQAQADQQLLEDARSDARTALLLERVLAEKYPDSPNRAEVAAKIQQGEYLLEELELSQPAPPSASAAVALTAIVSAFLLCTALLMADHQLLLSCIVLAAVTAIACLLLAGRQRRRRIWYNIDQTRRQAKHAELLNFVSSWKSQLRVLDELDRARENVTRTQGRLAGLEARVRIAPEPERPDSLTLSEAETLVAIRDCTQQLDRCRQELAGLRSQLSQLPGREALETELAQTRFRLRELEKTAQAIDHARSTLERLMQQQRSLLVLRIASRAEQLLEQLTGGARDRSAISELLALLTVPAGGILPPRSSGATDQQALALRLAMWEILTPRSPLILDNALLRFDQMRLERAMELLAELGTTRQILLFTCQEREEACMREMFSAQPTKKSFQKL